MVCAKQVKEGGMNSASSSATNRFEKHMGRSMRTIRSNFILNNTNTTTIDLHLQEELAGATKSPPPPYFSYSTFMTLSSNDDVSSEESDELQRLAASNLPPPHHHSIQKQELEPCQGFLQTRNFSSDHILLMESISSTEDLQLTTVKICVDSLNSQSVAIKRSAAANLRLLAKNRSDYRALIGESGAIPSLIPLLSSTDPLTQEHAVTALLNLSLLNDNKPLIVGSGSAAVKSIIYVLKTGTEVSKQNGACVLLSLALIDDNIKACIGASGAIPPLVSLLINARSNRGKKDALTTLYKLCSIKVNKKRAVTAGVVKPLVGLLLLEQEEKEGGMAEKAMVVLSSLCEIEEGRMSIVEQGGIRALLNVIQHDDDDTSVKGKDLAVVTLLQLVVCQNQDNKLLVLQLVAEGAIPPLVALSHTTTTRAKHKVIRFYEISLYFVSVKHSNNDNHFFK